MTWRLGTLLLVVVPALVAVSAKASAGSGGTPLLEARKGHVTKLVDEVRDADPFPAPPSELFSIVDYPGPLGPMKAYLGADPGDGKKHPAIIWLTGGFPAGGMDAAAWQPQSSGNDQSAKSYRQAGLVMMYPGLRGSMGNPGRQETFYGEVDDVLAAAAYLAKVPYVDPKRIYLGGHSTGGTLALLVAAATDRFEAVFAFGPIDDPVNYGQAQLTYDGTNVREARLRAPVAHLGAIRNPTFVIEGSRGNAVALDELKKSTSNRKLTFLEIPGVDHFEVLGPSNELIADRIRAKKDGAPLRLTAGALRKACVTAQTTRREASDLQTLSRLRGRGLKLSQTVELEFYLVGGPNLALIEPVGKEARGAGFVNGGAKRFTTDDGRSYAVLFFHRKVRLGDLPALFAASASAEAVARRYRLSYDGWWTK